MSSDEKALEEFRFEFGGINKVLIEGITRDIELFILKTRQEAREEERQRILGLPCMEEEPTEKDSGTIYLKAPLGGDPIPYHESIKLPITENIARNYLRRELKEEINI